MKEPKANNSEPPKAKTQDRISTALLEARRILLCDSVDMDLAEKVIRELWYLDLQAPTKPITLFINSPGGSVDAGFAIWDQIQLISSPVTTVVTGLAASMGSVLSLAAAPKKRFATPNARFMIHQPMIGGQVKGQATDLEIQAKEILKTRDGLIHLYMEATGKDFETIEKAIDRDTWMSAEEALEYGLIDKIVKSLKEI